MQDRNIGFLVFGLLLACYLFTYTGVIDSSDGLSMFATAESMVRRGEIDSNQLLWMGQQQGSFGPDGDLYSRKGLGMVLLAWPFVWLAWLWPALGLAQTALLLNPVITAYTGALLYRTGRRLGWRRETALAIALIFGLATLAWPYTQGFFSDPICGWGLLAALYGLLVHQQTGRKRYLLAGGAAWGMAYLARTLNLVTLPVYAAALLLILYQRQQTQAAELRTSLRSLFQHQWRPMVSFALPVVLAGLLSLWWNYARFGSPWVTGYVEEENFGGVWLAGLYGLTVGPARGFFWYSPILLLAAGGVGWFWRNARWLLAAIASIALLYLLIYGKWYMWHGGYSWGPRFLVPLAPLLALLVGPAWEYLVPRRAWGWGGRVAVFALLAISVGVQWLGMLVPFSLVQDWLAANHAPLFAPETFTRLDRSPLVLQWAYIQPQHIHLAWWQGGSIDWAALLATVAGALLGVVLIARSLRGGPEATLAERPRTNWLYGLFLCVVAVALLARYQPALADPELLAAGQRINQLEQAGDAILFLQPTQAQQFANGYHGRLPTYGLMPAGALGPDDQAWLARLETRYRRLWTIPDATPPEQSGWERALRTDAFLLQESRVPDSDGLRLALYATAQAATLTESGLGAIFGDPTRAESGVNETNGWIRLNGYGLTMESRPGEAILLALRWQSLRPVSENYHVFVHLLDAHGDRVAQRDGQPVQWMRPTSSWQPGEEIIDRYGLLLPADISPGEYRIAVGLYDAVSGQRLPVSAGPGDFAIELGPILIRRG